MLDMGYSVDEFARVLQPAMRDWPVGGQVPRWQVSGAQGILLANIAIAPQADRVIGALRLPVLHVTIAFTDAGDARRDEFMRRFERGFHRGGG